jgi:hypothetical protein
MRKINYLTELAVGKAQVREAVANLLVGSADDRVRRFGALHVQDSMGWPIIGFNSAQVIDEGIEFMPILQRFRELPVLFLPEPVISTSFEGHNGSLQLSPKPLYRSLKLKLGIQIRKTNEK